MKLPYNSILLQELPVFVSIVKDVFAGSNPEASSLQVQPLMSDLNLPLMNTPAVSSRVVIQVHYLLYT